MVLKLALLAFHMVETLFENLQKTSECDVIFAKQRPKYSIVALFNLCYVLRIVFIKHIKCALCRIQLCKETYIKYQ